MILVIDNYDSFTYNLVQLISVQGADVEVRRGRAHSVILAYAVEAGADLIVVASHQPGVQDFLLGSTAARVVRHATCSVLVLR